MPKVKTCQKIYKKLFLRFGAQHWWPGDSPFEVMVGAILTQNTNWQNVEKALNQLKAKKALSPLALRKLPLRKVAQLIRPAGYYNVKALRLRSFLDFFFSKYQGNIRKMRAAPTDKLRRQLLQVNGVGPETADSILLYALNKPVFVVDAYTRRVFSRHGMLDDSSDYQDIQNLFMNNLRKDVRLYNEYHALLVRLGKDYCLKTKARCRICPLM